MRVVGVVFASCLFLALPARAFGLTAMILPGWLDYYLILTLFSAGLAYVLTLLTKPSDVPMLRLGTVKLGPIAAFCYRLLKGFLLVFVALVTLGIMLMLAG